MGQQQQNGFICWYFCFLRYSEVSCNYLLFALLHWLFLQLCRTLHPHWSNSPRTENHTRLTHQPTGPPWLPTNPKRYSTKRPDYHPVVGCFHTIWTALIELVSLKSLKIPRSINLLKLLYRYSSLLPSNICFHKQHSLKQGSQPFRLIKKKSQASFSCKILSCFNQIL